MVFAKNEMENLSSAEKNNIKALIDKLETIYNRKDVSKAYDMISASLNEIIDDMEKTNGANLKQTVITIEVDEVKNFTPSEIKAIRLKNNLTQSLLAKFLCVSKKTVEAWESGKNKPNGPSSRLLELLSRKLISPVYS